MPSPGPIVLLLLALGLGSPTSAQASDGALEAQAPGLLKTVVPLLPPSSLAPAQAEALLALLPSLSCANPQQLEPLLPLLQRLEPRCLKGAVILAFALPLDLRLAWLARSGHLVFQASPEAGARLLDLLRAEGVTEARLEEALPPVAAVVSARDRKLAEGILDLLEDPAVKNRAAFRTALLSAAHHGDLPEWWAAHILDPALASLAAREGLLRAAELGTLDSETAERRLAQQKDRTAGLASIPRLLGFGGAGGAKAAARIGRLPQGPLQQQASFWLALGTPPKAEAAAPEGPWGALTRLWQAPPVTPPLASAREDLEPQDPTWPWAEDWELFEGAQRILPRYPRSARDGCEAIGDEKLRDECRFRIFLHALGLDPRGARNRLVEIVDSGLRLRAALLVARALDDGNPAPLLASLEPLFVRAGPGVAEEAVLAVLDQGVSPALAYYLLERHVKNPALRCRALWALGARAQGLEEVLPEDCAQRFCVAAGTLEASLPPLAPTL